MTWSSSATWSTVLGPTRVLPVLVSDGGGGGFEGEVAGREGGRKGVVRGREGGGKGE